MSEGQRPKLPTPFDEPPPAAATSKKGPAGGGHAGDRHVGDGPAADEPPPQRTRFSIGFLMLVTLVVAVATAGYNGMNLGGARRVTAILFTLLAPLALLFLITIVQAVRRRR